MVATYKIHPYLYFKKIETTEASTSHVQYPDYLNIWGTSRMPLYSRETFMNRFFSTETGLMLRISMNVEPVENGSLRSIHGSNSSEWITQRRA
jgi:hypothetical protein